MTFEQESHLPHVYECTAVRQGAEVSFDITIFDASKSGNEHLVDVEHMGGCRFAFSEAAADLAKHLQFCSSGALAGQKAVPSAPPALFLAPLPPPTFSRSSSASLTPEATSSPKAVADVDDAAALCAKHLLSMLGKNSSFDQKMQAARAVGGLALQQQKQQQQQQQQQASDNDAPVENTATTTNLFADKRWTEVAEAVAALAANGAVCGAASLQQEEQLQVVAMAALANMVALGPSTWPGAWLNGPAAETVAAGVQEDCHHLRREALRAAVDLARTAAPQLVRRGIIPHLERAAGGAEDGDCEDPLMARFAESALVACRN